MCYGSYIKTAIDRKLQEVPLIVVMLSIEHTFNKTFDQSFSILVPIDSFSFVELSLKTKVVSFFAWETWFTENTNKWSLSKFRWSPDSELSEYRRCTSCIKVSILKFVLPARKQKSQTVVILLFPVLELREVQKFRKEENFYLFFAFCQY